MAATASVKSDPIFSLNKEFLRLHPVEASRILSPCLSTNQWRC